MENISLKNLNLSTEESRDIIKFLARKINFSNYERMANEELLSTLKKPLRNKKKAKITNNKERIEIIREIYKSLGY